MACNHTAVYLVEYYKYINEDTYTHTYMYYDIEYYD